MMVDLKNFIMLQIMSDRANAMTVFRRLFAIHVS